MAIFIDTAGWASKLNLDYLDSSPYVVDLSPLGVTNFSVVSGALQVIDSTSLQRKALSFDGATILEVLDDRLITPYNHDFSLEIDFVPTNTTTTPRVLADCRYNDSPYRIVIWQNGTIMYCTIHTWTTLSLPGIIVAGVRNSVSLSKLYSPAQSAGYSRYALTCNRQRTIFTTSYQWSNMSQRITLGGETGTTNFFLGEIGKFNFTKLPKYPNVTDTSDYSFIHSSEVSNGVGLLTGRTPATISSIIDEPQSDPQIAMAKLASSPFTLRAAAKNPGKIIVKITKQPNPTQGVVSVVQLLSDLNGELVDEKFSDSAGMVEFYGLEMGQRYTLVAWDIQYEYQIATRSGILPQAA